MDDREGEANGTRLTPAILGTVVDDCLGLVLAGIQRAVANSVSEVHIRAETTRILGIATEVGVGLVKHALDAGFLRQTFG